MTKVSVSSVFICYVTRKTGAGSKVLFRHCKYPFPKNKQKKMTKSSELCFKE
jgi:hypothetical protein